MTSAPRITSGWFIWQPCPVGHGAERLAEHPPLIRLEGINEQLPHKSDVTGRRMLELAAPVVGNGCVDAALGVPAGPPDHQARPL
jgi:hypothetical protein